MATVLSKENTKNDKNQKNNQATKKKKSPKKTSPKFCNEALPCFQEGTVPVLSG